MTSGGGPDARRRGLGRAFSDIVAGSGESAGPSHLDAPLSSDDDELEAAAARLLEALLPGSTATWHDDVPPGAGVAVRFESAAGVRHLVVDRHRTATPTDIDRVHDIALLLMAAREASGPVRFRIERRLG